MAKILDGQRYKCSLAAMQSVQAIPGAIPVLHSGPGCAAKLSDTIGSSGHYSPNIFPCTSLNEKDVVFGGTRKLRTTIENAMKVLDADLYIVLTGCIPEIVGDDSVSVVDEFREAGKPVILAETAGFRGNSYTGYEQVLDAITDQYLEPAPEGEREKGLVNIFADVPYQALFWLGNYEQLAKLVSLLGLTPNVIFGYEGGTDRVRDIPKAEFNLLVSPWVGIEPMERMEKRLGIPFLHWPNLPVGAFETSKFLRALGEYAGVPSDKVESVIADQEGYYYYLIERYADLFLETRVMAKQFTVSADAQYSLALTKFLVNDLSLNPATQFVVDDTPKKYRESVAAEFSNLNHGIKAPVEFETDSWKISQAIRAHDYHGYPLVLGSYWEKEVTEEMYGHYLNISWPVQDKVVMDESYVGYQGGIKVIEDIYSVAVQRWN